MFQEQAALKHGVLPRSYWRYLEREGDEYEAFQREVLPAIFEQAREEMKSAERDIGSGVNGSGAWANYHKWRLEKRFRKIFGDLAQAPTRIEHSGPDGKPLQVTAGPITPEAAELMAKRMLFGEK
jgi:hypothetical protein